MRTLASLSGTIGRILPSSIVDRMRPHVDPRHERIMTVLDYIDPDDRVLDIGCVQHSLDDKQWLESPPGVFLHTDLRRTVDDVIGIDIATDGIRKMQTAGLDVRLADAHSFDLEQKFDVIVAGEIIEHLENPGLFLKSCRNHLNKGGKLIITTPNPRRMRMLFWFLTNQETNANDEHTMWFDPFVMQTLTSRMDFQIDDCHSYPPNITILSLPLYKAGVVRSLSSGGWVFVLSIDS